MRGIFGHVNGWKTQWHTLEWPLAHGVPLEEVAEILPVEPDPTSIGVGMSVKHLYSMALFLLGYVAMYHILSTDILFNIRVSRFPARLC